MPVIVRPSDHGSRSWAGRRYRLASSPELLLHYTLTDDTRTSPPRARQLIQSSFSGLERKDNVFAAKNGFVHACVDAYNEHHCLVIRPEDVWFAILTQFSAYINANSEELHRRFYSTTTTSGSSSGGSPQQQDGQRNHPHQHQNQQQQQQQHSQQQHHHYHQKELHIDVDLDGVDHGKMAFAMTKIIQENMRDDEGLREWVLPAFTTTTKVDQAVASIIFMGSMQKYFTYSWGTRCGIPSATLLGEETDWIRIRERAERLATFGSEPGRWLRLLRPVLEGFVASFRDPEGERAKRFWQGICDEHVPNGSGSVTYSGWITAFCFWDESGRCLHGSPKSGEGQGCQEVQLTRSQMPSGFSKVPVTLLNDGVEIPTEMVAGSMAIRALRSRDLVGADKSRIRRGAAGAANGAGAAGYDTIQPEVGWFMYKT